MTSHQRLFLIDGAVAAVVAILVLVLGGLAIAGVLALIVLLVYGTSVSVIRWRRRHQRERALRRFPR